MASPPTIRRGLKGSHILRPPPRACLVDGVTQDCGLNWKPGPCWGHANSLVKMPNRKSIKNPGKLRLPKYYSDPHPTLSGGAGGSCHRRFSGSVKPGVPKSSKGEPSIAVVSSPESVKELNQKMKGNLFSAITNGKERFQERKTRESRHWVTRGGSRRRRTPFQAKYEKYVKVASSLDRRNGIKRFKMRWLRRLCV